MRLIVEVVGALCVAAMARAVLPSGGLERRAAALRPALTALAVVVGGIAFWTGVWPTARDLVSRHDRDSRLTAEQALALPGTGLPATTVQAREDVLAWADALLPRNARVFLACAQPAPCSNALANWITYRLQPRVFTDFPSQAQWILFYGTPTQATPVTSLRLFAPGYAIGRVPR